MAETVDGIWYIYEIEDTVESLGEVIDRGNHYKPVFRDNDGNYTEGDIFTDLQKVKDYIISKLEVEEP